VIIHCDEVVVKFSRSHASRGQSNPSRRQQEDPSGLYWNHICMRVGAHREANSTYDSSVLLLLMCRRSRCACLSILTICLPLHGFFRASTYLELSCTCNNPPHICRACIHAKPHEQKRLKVPDRARHPVLQRRHLTSDDEFVQHAHGHHIDPHTIRLCTGARPQRLW
jgi:hypothetical protein